MKSEMSLSTTGGPLGPSNPSNSRGTKPTEQKRSKQDLIMSGVTIFTVNSDILNSITSQLGISTLPKMSCVSKDWHKVVQQNLNGLRYIDLILGIPTDSKTLLKQFGFIGDVNNFKLNVNYSREDTRSESLSNVNIQEIDPNTIRITVRRYFVRNKESESTNRLIHEIRTKLSAFGLGSDASLARSIAAKVIENGEQYFNCDVLKILMEATPLKAGPLVKVVDDPPPAATNSGDCHTRIISSEGLVRRLLQLST